MCQLVPALPSGGYPYVQGLMSGVFPVFVTRDAAPIRCNGP